MQNNYLTDTHFHLTLTDDIPSILKRAKENGVNNFIISGCNLKSIQEGIEIINKYPLKPIIVLRGTIEPRSLL